MAMSNHPRGATRSPTSEERRDATSPAAPAGLSPARPRGGPRLRTAASRTGAAACGTEVRAAAAPARRDACHRRLPDATRAGVSPHGGTIREFIGYRDAGVPLTTLRSEVRRLTQMAPVSPQEREKRVDIAFLLLDTIYGEPWLW